MANESSTNERAEQFYFAKYPEHAAEGGSVLDHDAIELMAAYATQELARVRGLLQRQWISVEERWPEMHYNLFVAHQGTSSEAIYQGGGFWWLIETDGYGDVIELREEVTHWMPMPEPPQNSETTVSPAVEGLGTKRDNPSGRRTTDLAAADKSVEYSSQNQTKTMCTQDAYDQIGKVITTSSRGRAETGGEKAAPQNELLDAKICERCGHLMHYFGWRHVDAFAPYKECWRPPSKEELLRRQKEAADMRFGLAYPEKCHALDLPGGFLGQRCGECDSLFANSNFKFCSECGAHLVYAIGE